MSTGEPENLIQQRKKKLQAIAGLGFETYPRRYACTHTLPEILSQYSARGAEERWMGAPISRS